MVGRLRGRTIFLAAAMAPGSWRLAGRSGAPGHLRVAGRSGAADRSGAPGHLRAVGRSGALGHFRVAGRSGDPRRLRAAGRAAAALAAASALLAAPSLQPLRHRWSLSHPKRLRPLGSAINGRDEMQYLLEFVPVTLCHFTARPLLMRAYRLKAGTESMKSAGLRPARGRGVRHADSLAAVFARFLRIGSS